MIKIGLIIILNACIWGFVMVTCSMALKDTGAYQEIQNILIGGASASLLLLSSLTFPISKNKK